jgi:nucleotide-binding universal stress UspA family protein
MYKKIMVPLDGSVLSESVLPHLESFISGFSEAEVVFVRVVEPASIHASAEFMNVDELIGRDSIMKSTAEEYLKRVVDRLKYGETKLYTKVIIGKLEESLVHYAEENDIDLILIATHGRSGIDRWVRGSVAEKVLRSSNIPVMMVRIPVKPL